MHEDTHRAISRTSIHKLQLLRTITHWISVPFSNPVYPEQRQFLTPGFASCGQVLTAPQATDWPVDDPTVLHQSSTTLSPPRSFRRSFTFAGSSTNKTFLQSARSFQRSTWPSCSILIAWNVRSLTRAINVVSISQKFPAFHRSLMFTTAPAKATMSLTSANSIQFPLSHPI